MEKTDYLAVIDHALASIFIVTKKMWEDEKDEGNDFFLHLEIGTILTVEAVICTDFGLDARVSYLDDGEYKTAEFDIEYLATHCDLHGEKQKFFFCSLPVNTPIN